MSAERICAQARGYYLKQATTQLSSTQLHGGFPSTEYQTYKYEILMDNADLFYMVCVKKQREALKKKFNTLGPPED
jgi:hypothetical protein